MAPFVLKSGHSAQSHVPILSSRGNTTLKSCVASGETLYGLFLMSISPTIAEIVGLASNDFVVVDMEHGPGSISDALSSIHALDAAVTPPSSVSRRSLPPGKRRHSTSAHRASCSHGGEWQNRLAGSLLLLLSTSGTDDTYVHRCEEELLILCMVETEAGVDNIKAITAVDGVDSIQMGPRDLGASMGYLTPITPAAPQWATSAAYT